MDDNKKKPENEDNQGKNVAEEKTSHSLMKLVKLGIVIAVLLGEAYGANAVMSAYYPTIYKYLNKNKAADKKENIFEISDLIVNPAITQNGNPHFLVVSIGISLKSQADVSILKNRESMAKDAIISILGKHKLSYLEDLLKREGLKQQIGIVINRVLERKAVEDLYFTKFVIQ